MEMMSGADSPLSSTSLPMYLRRHVRERPTQPAVIDGTTGEALTYAELSEQSGSVAATLRRMGVGHGDRVGIIATNSLPYVVLLWALADLGAIAVPQNTRLNSREMTDNLRDAQVSALVADETLVEAASGIADELGLSARLLFDGSASGWELLDRNSSGDSGAAVDEGEERTEPTGEDTCTLLYTSGTTGTAKGCMLAQRSWVGYSQNLAIAMRMTSDDTYLAFLPFFHVAGLGMLLSQLILGGTVVTQASPEPARLHALIKQHGVTIVMLVPGPSLPFVTHPEAASPGETTLRLFVSAIGLEQQAVIDGATQRLGVEFCGIYGQTESGTKTTWATADEIRSHPGTYGRVMPSLAYRIVDTNDDDVADGEPGELLLRGSTIMQGYWNRPEATAETLKGGWHHTGDVFVHEGGGMLRMVDRTKYLIKTGGENVYPQEVENVLKTHPDVADVAVVGIPDPKWGETIKAFVVSGTGEGLSRSDLDAYVRQSIAGYKAPRYIEFVTDIPRNVSGKILKNDLAARATDESQRVTKETS